MSHKDFLFIPGLWLGEGKITFTSSPEFLKFYTKWEISQISSDLMKAVQVVEIQGVEEHVVNTFTFTDITSTTFAVSLENNLVGKVSGTGLRNDRVIAWEFRGQSAFEGFETYERQENGDYFLHAEYGPPSDFRTIVEGLIWSKS